MVVVVLDGLYSVADASQLLSLSPRRIRALIAQGALPADRVGRDWLIPAHAVADFAPRRGGRPMAPAVAWACLTLLAGAEPTWLSPSHLARLRQRMNDELQGEPLEAAVRLRSWCASRAQSVRYRALSPVLDEMRHDKSLLLAGVSADPAIRDYKFLEAYVPEAALVALAHDYRLPQSGSPRSNLLLRVVHDLPVVPVSSTRAGRVADIVIGVDLLDSAEPRGQRAALRYVGQALGDWTQGGH